MLNFQALAAGTLLYVCVFEILEREKSKEHVPGLLQLLFVILGFTTLLLVTILSKEKTELLWNHFHRFLHKVGENI